MCDFASIASGTLNAGSALLGMNAQNKAVQQQMNAQYKAAITDMNFAWQDYELQRRDAFDATIGELEKVTANEQSIGSQAKHAVLENMQGRTARLLLRNIEGDYNRARSSIKDNYSRQSDEISQNKERVAMNTKSYIRNLNESAPKAPSALSQALTVGSIALGSYTGYQDRRQIKKNAGGK